MVRTCRGALAALTDVIGRGPPSVVAAAVPGNSRSILVNGGVGVGLVASLYPVKPTKHLFGTTCYCLEHVLGAAATAIVIVVLRRAGHPVRRAVLAARFDVGDAVFSALLDVSLACVRRVCANLLRNRSRCDAVVRTEASVVARRARAFSLRPAAAEVLFSAARGLVVARVAVAGAIAGADPVHVLV